MTWIVEDAPDPAAPKLYHRCGEPITNDPYEAVQYGANIAAAADYTTAEFAKGVIKALSGGRAYLEIYQDALTLTAHAGDWIVKNGHGEVEVIPRERFAEQFEPYEAPEVTSSVLTVVDVPNTGTDITPPRIVNVPRAKYLDGTPVTEVLVTPAPAMLEVSPQLLLAILKEREALEPYEVEGSVAIYIAAKDFYMLWEDAGRRTSDEQDPQPRREPAQPTITVEEVK